MRPGHVLLVLVLLAALAGAPLLLSLLPHDSGGGQGEGEACERIGVVEVREETVRAVFNGLDYIVVEVLPGGGLSVEVRGQGSPPDRTIWPTGAVAGYEFAVFLDGRKIYEGFTEHPGVSVMVQNVYGEHTVHAVARAYGCVGGEAR